MPINPSHTEFPKSQRNATMPLRQRFLGYLAQVPRPLWIPLIALFFGTLALPVAAYIAGSHLIAPYEGEHGLASFFGSIYADAARGRPLALSLLFGPTLVLGIWKFNAWAWRRTAA
jgi:hypothetical protein